MLPFIVCLILLSNVQADYYNGRFFDPKNLTYAECIPEKQFYSYFGTLNTALNGRKCANWSKVRKDLSQTMNGYYQYFFPTEYEDHDHCRTLLLDQYERHSLINNASAHSFVEFENWQKGPWCYVENIGNEKSKLWFGQFRSKYRPWPCFSTCVGSKDPKTTTPTQTTPKPKQNHYKHYNEDLIENLSDRFFSNFSYGDMRYYNQTAKKDTLSIGFQIRRHYIFFTFFGILLVAIAISIGTYAWNRYKQKRRSAKDADALESKPDENTSNDERTEQQVNANDKSMSVDNKK